jgi:flagellar biosynthesis protein FlhF
VNLKTYQALTMSEALTAVRTDLGADAVILHTRSFRRGGLLGIGRRTIIEVTAATAADARRSGDLDRVSPEEADRPGRHAARGNAAALRAYGRQRAAAVSPEISPERRELEDVDRIRTRRLAQALAEQQSRAPRAAGMAARPQPAACAPPPLAGTIAPALPATAGARGADGPATIDSSAPTRRFILTPTARTAAPGDTPGHERPQRRTMPDIQLAPPPPPGPGGSAGSPASSGSPARGPSSPLPPFDRGVTAMQEELAAIRRMVSQVLQRQVIGSRRATPMMPAALLEMYLNLIGQDLSEELADQVIQRVHDDLGPDALDDPIAVRAAATRHLAELVPSADPAIAAASPDGRPLTIALVGPTGVGKTTTAAKLAASLKLRHHRSVGLITCDTYRIAAVDQLRTYASIIGVPLEVVLTPAEMGRAVQALGQCDVILIDTAGRGQNDSSRLDELRQFVASAAPHEVHLVLSSTASERVLLNEAEAFSVLGPSRIVLTKLDEAVSFGVLINVMRKLGTALSFVTTGQEVPDDIEMARPERLAALVVDREGCVPAAGGAAL